MTVAQISAFRVGQKELPSLSKKSSYTISFYFSKENEILKHV